MVASQLLHSPANSSADIPIVADTRVPPKVKNQLANKNKLQTRHEDSIDKLENFHAGIAVPVTMEELESENKVSDTESTTSNEGISTWIRLNNPSNKDNVSSPTEATKPEEVTKKTKPNTLKNKTKRPQQNGNKTQKRPIIGSTNKSDLIAGGSAINENVFNKIKDTVLSNVQKNKNTTPNHVTTVTTTTFAPDTSVVTNKKEVSTKIPTFTVLPTVKITSKPIKKKNKNKNKHKIRTTEAPILSESALLPMEPKEQEIELEISTPASTTKKPKRTTSKTKKKKNKNKKKTSKPDLSDVSLDEVKTTNKTKSSKPSKKPNAITTQIYNYLSREVMPSVGVGIVGLASLVGLAGYFLYPFATPVRRTYEVDKKDDIYRHNAEEYANEGNGQAEEEMLGTVLAGMPAHSKHKLNPYIAQTNYRYPTKKEPEQNIRYRHVATSQAPNYNIHYQQNYQQKTGIAHGAVYADPISYTQYETRHAYTTENKFPYENKNAYTYAAVEPIYAAPQTGPSGVSSYGSDAGNSVVYGVKPSHDTEFKPVYPYEGQVYSETTSQSSMTYQPTSMYLGSNNESEQSEEAKYADDTNTGIDNKFVVGNVPKELVDNVTPAIVPEHGPRKLNRRKRSTKAKKRSIVTSIEDILKAVKEENRDLYLSNEIEEVLGLTTMKSNIETTTDYTSTTHEPPKIEFKTTESFNQPSKETESDKTTVYPVYAISIDAENSDKEKSNTIPTFIDEVVESVSTFPLQTEKPTEEPDMSNELDGTTKPFRVYEVFSKPPTELIKSNTETLASIKEDPIESTTEARKVEIETTTDTKSETTTLPSTTSPTSQTKGPTEPIEISTKPPKPTFDPNVITYPPYNQEGGFFTFLKRLFEFKYRLGMSILQTTSDSLNRYLRSMENSVQKVAKASQVSKV